MADILNRLDKIHFDSALQHLSAARPADVEAMRGLLFSFDDLASLPPRALTLVFNQIPTERLVLALRGTDYAFQEGALTGLAARTRRMVELELEAASDASAREIADARRAIVEVVLKLMAERQIELPVTSARAQAG
jgi:flagellar motor switch protein FliG